MILNELKNWEMLSQVWFVHDYVQLTFHDDHRIDIYNPFSVKVDGKVFLSGKPGYADSLVGLIGSAINEVSYQKHDNFTMKFDNSSEIIIHLTKGLVNSPEAFETGLSDGPYIEFNE